MAFIPYVTDSGQFTGTITVADTGTSTATGSNSSSIYTGTPTAGSFVSINALNYNSFSLQVSNAWVGTLQVENSYDGGVTWYRVVPQVRGVSNSAATITANGGFISEAAVATNVRVRAIAWTSGTANIAFMQSPSSEIVRVDNPIRLYDNASSTQASIKPASTAPIATDTALVTVESPNSPLNVRGQTIASASLPVIAASDQLFLNVTNSVSALNGDLFPATDVSMYRSFNIALTGTFNANYSFQGSNDNFATTASTFLVPVNQMSPSGLGGIVSSSSTTNILWRGAISYRYLRIRVTSYTSGTVTGAINLSQAPLDSFYNYSSVTGTVTATPPNATASGNITATAQTLNLGTNLIGGGGFGVITVSGTYAGVSFTVSSSTNNGTVIYSVPVYDTNAGVWLKPGSTITPGTNATNTYWVTTAPYANQTRLVSTAYTSGTMVVGYGASVNGTPGSIIAAPQLVAATTNPTASTSGTSTIALADKLGKQVTVQSIRDLKGRQATTLTSTTTETTIVTAGAAGVFNDLYGLVITNTSPTATTVTIRDVTAGGTPLVFQVPASDTRGLMLSESAALKQGTAASAWTAQCGTSVNAIQVTALYVANL